MKTTSIVAALAAALPALAAPAVSTVSASSTDAFTGVAIRSGSEIQYASVNANGTYFWLHRGSATYTPATVSGFNVQNYTLFTGGDDTLALDVAVPGGQQVYVDSEGLLRFTSAHSANTGTGSKQTGFSIDGSGHLQFESGDFLACKLAGAADNAYQVYASAYHSDDSCLSFAFRRSETDGPAAYEYD